MSEKELELVDHKDGAVLITEVINKFEPMVACNVISMFKNIFIMLSDLNERITTIEGLIDV